jgi:hypothetical protein
MYKVFPTFAVLMAIMLAMVWMVGCGGEDEEVCEITVEVKSTAPDNGGEMAKNGAVTVTFEGGSPDADSVTINGKAAECKGATCSAEDIGLTEGQTVDIEIKWTYCKDIDVQEGSYTITGVTVTALDETPPAIKESSLGDGEDLDPEDLKETVSVTFTEPMDSGKTKDIYFEIEGEKLIWRISEWTDGDQTVVLEYKSDADIGYESEVKLVIKGATDKAGNEADLEIEFTTRAKE